MVRNILRLILYGFTVVFLLPIVSIFSNQKTVFADTPAPPEGSSCNFCNESGCGYSGVIQGGVCVLAGGGGGGGGDCDSGGDGGGDGDC